MLRAIALLTGSLSLASVWLCACASDSDDVRREDASLPDSAPGDDGGSNGDASSSEDAAAEPPLDAGSDPCGQPCGTARVCCVDQHGHFPRCVDGSACAPPLQPAP
jgi:hypothetical protein